MKLALFISQSHSFISMDDSEQSLLSLLKLLYTIFSIRQLKLR